MRTPKAAKGKPLPEVEYRFIEEEMGTTEPLMHVLEQQKRSLEEQGPASFIAFFYTDYLAWIALENALPVEKATDIYLDLWRTFPPMWAKDARVDLWVGKPETTDELADILVYCEKKKYMPYTIKQENGSITLTSSLNPYVEVLSAFGQEKGCLYFKALTKRDQDFIDLLLKEERSDETFKATLTKAVSEGDDVNQIEISKK